MKMTLQELLKTAAEKNASDLHLQAAMPPMLRVDGALQAVAETPLQAAEVETLLHEGLPEADAAHVQDLDYQTAFEVPGVGRVRASLYQQNRTPAATLRIIPSTLLPFEQYGFPEGVRKLCELPRGLVLVTGASGGGGCGKTTTLMAMLELINASRVEKIISIGDPVEFVLQPKRSIIAIREVGVDTASYAQAFRAALRQDPDIIHVSEMRDLETVMLAITAAEMGHLVFTNMHCANASEALLRIVDVFPEQQRDQVRRQLAENLGGVVAQRLLPKAGGKGRVPVCEVLIATPEVRALIRDHGLGDLTPVMEKNHALGMQSFAQALEGLVVEGRLEREAVTA
jgi:twitching motility protein PilT